jgi:hypothetical protein
MGLPLVEIPWPMAATVSPERVHEAEGQDLVIFGQCRSVTQKKAILQATQRDDSPAVLICPESATPLARVLLLDQADREANWLFDTAAKIGPFFSEGLVVLTLARSQRAGQVRQQEVRDRLNDMDCPVDFDLLISHDVRAIRSVAEWRQCSLMVLQRMPQSLWGRLWGDPVAEILKMSGLPPMLAFTHGGAAFHADHRAVSRASSPQPANT